MRYLIARAMMLSFAGRVRCFRAFPLVAYLLFLAALAAPATASKKIIFDTDPGTDDALALMLALNSPELDVRAITVVPGNVTAEMGLEDGLRMGSFVNHCGVPVATGSSDPLLP